VADRDVAEERELAPETSLGARSARGQAPRRLIRAQDPIGTAHENRPDGKSIEACLVRDQRQLLAPPDRGEGIEVAGQTGIEPATPGFGDRCSANCATALHSTRLTVSTIRAAGSVHPGRPEGEPYPTPRRRQEPRFRPRPSAAYFTSKLVSGSSGESGKSGPPNAGIRSNAGCPSSSGSSTDQYSPWSVATC